MPCKLADSKHRDNTVRRKQHRTGYDAHDPNLGAARRRRAALCEMDQPVEGIRRLQRANEGDEQQSEHAHANRALHTVDNDTGRTERAWRDVQQIVWTREAEHQRDDGGDRDSHQ